MFKIYNFIFIIDSILKVSVIITIYMNNNNLKFSSWFRLHRLYGVIILYIQFLIQFLYIGVPTMPLAKIRNICIHQ